MNAPNTSIIGLQNRALQFCAKRQDISQQDISLD